MGDDQPQPERPSGPPPATPRQVPAEHRLGSEEAGLHETPGAGVTMPSWAQGLEHGAAVPTTRLRIDLAKRLAEEEAARVAREQAAREAAERQREQAKAKARADREAEKARPAPVPPGGRPNQKKVSKWPSALAAVIVIIIGAAIATQIQSGPEPQTVTDSPVAIASEIPRQEDTASGGEAVGGPVTVYVVRAGDTLDSIAKAAGKSPDEISAANGSSEQPIQVRPGQRINIP